MKRDAYTWKSPSGNATTDPHKKKDSKEKTTIEIRITCYGDRGEAETRKVSETAGTAEVGYEDVLSSVHQLCRLMDRTEDFTDASPVGELTVLHRQTGIVEIKTGEGLRRVPVSSITHVDIDNRTLCFHLRDGYRLNSTTIRNSFAQAARGVLELKDFVRVRAGLAINLKHVEIVGRDAIRLSNNVILKESPKMCRRVLTVWQKGER